MAMVSQPFSSVVGVDTHARTHTFALLDAATGLLLDTRTFPTTLPGRTRAAQWITRTAGPPTLVAVEGSGSYGATLTGTLQAAGLMVAEMDAPIKRHHKRGKSDPLDAEDIARRAIAAGDRFGRPRAASGDRAAIHVLLTARQAITSARTAAVNQLTALARIHELGLDARRALTPVQLRTIAGWRARSDDDIGLATARAEAVRLATEIRHRDSELAANETGLRRHVTAIAPALLDQPGIGPMSAARLITVYSHKGRIRSEAAFARLAGVAPIPASSGNTIRHRLSHGGDRNLNNALWRIAFHRYHHDPATQAFANRKLADGRTPREILRTLKRYIARALFRQMNTIMT